MRNPSGIKGVANPAIRFADPTNPGGRGLVRRLVSMDPDQILGSRVVLEEHFLAGEWMGWLLSGIGVP